MKKQLLQLEDKSKETDKLQIKEVAGLLNLKPKKEKVVFLELDSDDRKSYLAALLGLNKNFDVKIIDYTEWLAIERGK